MSNFVYNSNEFEDMLTTEGKVMPEIAIILNNCCFYDMRERSCKLRSVGGLSTGLLPLQPYKKIVEPRVRNNILASRYINQKSYELKDHLGNVNSVVSDLKTATLTTGGEPENFGVTLKTITNYYPFGAPLSGRTVFGNDYRFGFNGKENVDEVFGVTGGFQDYGMRDYDTRIARFIKVDPLTKSYPMLTPYQFASNTPIWAIDLDGLERLIYTKKRLYHEDANKKIPWSVVANSGRLQWMNDPNSQSVKYNHATGEGGGPIPEGNYFVSLDNTNDRLTKGDKSGGAWGKYSIRLDYGFWQAVNLKLFNNNRSGFYLHEDGNQFEEGGEGSGGCIACTKGNDILKVKTQILEYYNAGMDELDVKVDYDYTPDLNYTVNTKKDPLNFRASPGGSKIGSLNKGTNLMGTGNVNGSWTEVQTDSGQTGWVSSEYLKTR